MVRISVIMPVYNCEKYLEKSLDSLVNQSFGDIEIICVNDGSTDGTSDILNEYQKRDSRIRIINQQNKGAGASRNIGLSEATGECIYFMDSDDYLDFDAFEKLIGFIDDNEFDFIIFKISNFLDETGKLIDDDYYNMPYLKSRVGLDSFNYNNVKDFALELCVCPPGNLFRREFISDVRFPEGLLFEDNVFFTHALFKAEKIYFYDEFLYNRRKHTDSTTTPLTVKSLDIIDIASLLLDLCDEYHHENHKEELYYRIFHNIYRLFKRADESQKELFFERIRQDYLKNKEKWENDNYFKKELKPRYRHIFECAIKSRNADEFESCVDSYSAESRFKRLRKKLL
ncbi:glycosyltransferase family 2 protein [Methanobrevibacter sp.]|uniref:glycosyltransferase family 2 protein n=1 Tax=Methanobrevibacter sp. TaxID=66852 RepID=UPI0025CDFAFF|nr:glycosyltransferase family 2 protein [Methanobrevibacter sp.]MBQ2666102.1 glycosyltransferase family 2 protein [Methanobrevibacter sp.]